MTDPQPDTAMAPEPRTDPVVTVSKNERGAWCVYLDGQMVSDHATHSAARIAASRHIPTEVSDG